MKSISAAFVASLICCCGTHDLPAADQTGVAKSSLYPVHALTCPEALLRGCCGVYYPKPLPCMTGFCRGCRPDNYCPKECPSVSCFRGRCGFTYCPKPCPDLCRPLAADFFVCVPRSQRCPSPAPCASATPSSPDSPVVDSPDGGAEFQPRLPQ
jgi:hypothetical protein